MTAHTSDGFNHAGLVFSPPLEGVIVCFVAGALCELASMTDIA